MNAVCLFWVLLIMFNNVATKSINNVKNQEICANDKKCENICDGNNCNICSYSICCETEDCNTCVSRRISACISPNCYSDCVVACIRSDRSVIQNFQYLPPGPCFQNTSNTSQSTTSKYGRVIPVYNYRYIESDIPGTPGRIYIPTQPCDPPLLKDVVTEKPVIWITPLD